jgi:hypothetical protein
MKAMCLRGALVGFLVLLSVRPVPAQTETVKHPRPLPPTLVSPIDDPHGHKCLRPDGAAGVKFAWKLEGTEADGDSYPVASYIDILRRDHSTREWRPWVRKYANPPFVMLARPQIYAAEFAWRVWAVDRSGEAQPYAVSSLWQLFCTLPMEQPPASGSSSPHRRR